MAKMLREGEIKEFKRESFGGNISVTAECVDCDTPLIHVTVGGGCCCLTDAGANDLIKLLQKALRILPSSK